MTASRRCFGVAAGVILAVAAPRTTVAQSTSGPGRADVACGVRVAFVTPLDARSTLQAVVLEPDATGASVPAGAVALFTAANRRYDVPFDGATDAAGTPLVLLVRFPASVNVSGAYVTSLAGTAPVRCAIADPWTAGLVPDDAATRAVAGVIAQPLFDRNAVAVTGSGVPDPLRCGAPSAPARTLHEVPPAPSFFADASDLPHGTVSVRVTVGSDGQAVDAHIDRADATMDETAAGQKIESTTLVAAMHSSYAPATFRCRPIRGIAYYTIVYSRHT